MSDDTKQELDNFGVWVKKPPVDSSADELDPTTLAIPTATEPDTFDEGDTTLSLSELTAITSNMITEGDSAPMDATASNGIEEVSLDEFITDFDDPNPDTAASNEPEAVTAEEPVSTSSFAGVTDNEIVESTPIVAEADDQPLNIDLSFDESEETPATTQSAVTDAVAPAAASDGGMESVDLSEFGFDDQPAAESNEAAPEPAAATDSNGMESVDLSEFGFDDNSDGEASASSSEPPATAEQKQEDDFNIGLDSEDELSTPVVEEMPTTEAEPAPAPATEAISEPVAEAAPEAQPAAAPAPVTPQPTASAALQGDAATAILQQIMGELHSLKDEIANLKTDFENIKNGVATTQPATAEPVAESDPLPPAEDVTLDIQAEEQDADSVALPDSASSGGFFGDDDEDDTIALSLDEMDNILNTADFSEEPVEATESAPAAEDESVLGTIDASVHVPEQEYTQDSELQMDFSNESIEEPDIVDLEETTQESAADEQLPDEIAVPKVDDVIVESESLDDGEETAKAEPETVEEPLTEENLQYLAEDAEVSEPTTEEPSVSTATEDQAEVTAATEEQDEEPSIEPIPVTEDIAPIEMELPTEEPVATTEEPKETAPTEKVAEPAVATPAPEPVAASDGIPNDLRQEIKYVLSYMDQLLENLPEEKIAEFAQSEQFETYKKLFKELGLA